MMPIISFMRAFDFIKTTSKNLRRIRLAHNLSQTLLAEKINSTPSTISNYETGAERMHPDYIERICTALGDVRPWEFYLEDDTPIIQSEKEKQALLIIRQAEVLRVAEDIVHYGEYRVKEARHEASYPGAAKKTRVARHKGRP